MTTGINPLGYLWPAYLPLLYGGSTSTPSHSHIKELHHDGFAAFLPRYLSLPISLPRSPVLHLYAKNTHTHSYGSMTSRPTSPKATQVNIAHHIERPSVKLKIPSGKSNILNSVVVGAADKPLYTVSSNSKRTTFVACQNNAEVATVQWDRSSPRMVLRGKKMKCKEWLPLAGLATKCRMLSHNDSRFVWMERSPPTSGYLIPANRPGLAVARWYISSHSDDLDMEIFQEALVEPGLLEAIILSVILLRCGRSLSVPPGTPDVLISFRTPGMGVG